MKIQSLTGFAADVADDVAAADVVAADVAAADVAADDAAVDAVAGVDSPSSHFQLYFSVDF